MRVCGRYWQERGDSPELQRPLCITLLAGLVILHHVVPSICLELTLLCHLCCVSYVLAHPNAIILNSQSPSCHQCMDLSIQWEGKEPEGREGGRSGKSMKQIFYASFNIISFSLIFSTCHLFCSSNKVVELSVGSFLMPFRYVECICCWLCNIWKKLPIIHHKIFKDVA